MCVRAEHFVNGIHLQEFLIVVLRFFCHSIELRAYRSGNWAWRRHSRSKNTEHVGKCVFMWAINTVINNPRPRSMDSRKEQKKTRKTKNTIRPIKWPMRKPRGEWSRWAQTPSFNYHICEPSTNQLNSLPKPIKFRTKGRPMITISHNFIGLTFFRVFSTTTTKTHLRIFFQIFHLLLDRFISFL